MDLTRRNENVNELSSAVFWRVKLKDLMKSRTISIFRLNWNFFRSFEKSSFSFYVLVMVMNIFNLTWNEKVMEIILRRLYNIKFMERWTIALSVGDLMWFRYQFRGAIKEGVQIIFFFIKILNLINFFN